MEGGEVRWGGHRAAELVIGWLNLNISVGRKERRKK